MPTDINITDVFSPATLPRWDDPAPAFAPLRRDLEALAEAYARFPAEPASEVDSEVACEMEFAAWRLAAIARVIGVDFVRRVIADARREAYRPDYFDCPDYYDEFEADFTRYLDEPTAVPDMREPEPPHGRGILLREETQV